MKVAGTYRPLIQALEALPVDYQAAALEALVDIVTKYRKSLRDRPYPLRDKAQAWGVIREEYLELEDETRRDVDDTDVPKLQNDYCELSTASLAAYVDIGRQASARSTVPALRFVRNGVKFFSGGYAVACTTCRRAQAVHRRVQWRDHQRVTQYLCGDCSKRTAA